MPLLHNYLYRFLNLMRIHNHNIENVMLLCDNDEEKVDTCLANPGGDINGKF